MKIFSRSAEKEKPAASATKAPSAAPPASSAPAGPAAASAAPPAAAAPAAPLAPAAPPAPDISAIIDANVKEMSEKIARLATSIEGDKGDRADFEAKIEKMEERMRKLSALTEMISAQYNPFVGAAPSEREAPPQPELGLSQPPSTLPLPPAPPAAAAPPAATAPPPALAAEPASSPIAISLEDPLASVASSLVPPPPAPEAAMEPFPAPPAEAAALALATPEELAAPPAQYDDSDDDQGSVAVATSADAAAQENPARLWSVRPTFGSSMLMLSWADMLLKNAPDRQAFVQLLDYYQNISWIGAPAREQLLAYADGIRSSASADGSAEGAGDWRAPLDVHERSLLFVEKLRAISVAGRSQGD